jgi:hypothetical protein
MDAREHVSARAAELRRHAEEAERKRRAREQSARFVSERLDLNPGWQSLCKRGRKNEAPRDILLQISAS